LKSTLRRINFAIFNGESNWFTSPAYLLLLIACIPFTLLFFIFQRVGSNFILIRIGKIRNQHFGHFLLETDYYLSLKRLKNEQHRSLDLFYFAGTSSNKYYQRIVRKKMIFLPKFLLIGTHLMNKFLANNQKFTIQIPDRLIDLRILDKLENSIEMKCEPTNLPKTFSFNPNKRCVAFYLRSTIKKNDVFALRNVVLSSYTESINLLTSRKFDVYVFSDQYIDQYTGKEIKRIVRSSNRMKDLAFQFYITSICDFAVATDSGSFHLPYLFRKPIILTNICSPIGCIESSLIISKLSKRWIDQESGKDVDFRTFKPHLTFDNDKVFKENRVMMIDNTPEQLSTAIKVVLEREFH
jgi:putative glycosyltransferase (TIGR04372 family)